jgi:hypothetical protein
VQRIFGRSISTFDKTAIADVAAYCQPMRKSEAVDARERPGSHHPPDGNWRSDAEYTAALLFVNDNGLNRIVAPPGGSRAFRR